MTTTKSKDNPESIMKWLDKEIEYGENSILVYPNLQALRQIYTHYVKDQSAAAAAREKEEVDSILSQESSLTKSRITLIAPFYETVDSVKHHLSASGGVENVQGLIESGSLVIVDSLHSFFPDPNGMKRLIDSLSQRARKEGRDGVTAIVDMGFFFLFGGDSKAAHLISYEVSLAPKTQDGNVKGISCYHWENYETLTDADKEQISLGQRKKLLEVEDRSNNKKQQ